MKKIAVVLALAGLSGRLGTQLSQTVDGAKLVQRGKTVPATAEAILIARRNPF